VPSKNVERQHRAIEAFNARDIDAYIALCDQLVEVHSTFAAVGGVAYRGHDGIRSWWRDLEDAWGGEIRIEPESYFDFGEQILAFYVLHGRGRQSGVEVAVPGAAVQKWREGLSTYIKGYAHREDALADLGVSEEALERIDPVTAAAG
jgi:ketosteroid isomerase-like protein